MNEPIGTENDLCGTKPRKQFKLKTKTDPLVVYAGGSFSSAVSEHGCAFYMGPAVGDAGIADSSKENFC